MRMESEQVYYLGKLNYKDQVLEQRINCVSFSIKIFIILYLHLKTKTVLVCLHLAVLDAFLMKLLILLSFLKLINSICTL